jgi:peptidoglycan hydrolase CwlO-like protein
MQSDLTNLDKKISSLIELCNKLKVVNLRLKQNIARLENENQDLNTRITLASEKISSIMERLPDEIE